MAAKLKYQKVLKGYHYYQRAIPKDLREVAKARGIPNPFVKSTGLDQYAPLSAVERALDDWSSVFDDIISLLERSSNEEIEKDQRARLVTSFLKAQGYTAGQFASATEDDNVDEALWATLEDLFGNDLQVLFPRTLQ